MKKYFLISTNDFTVYSYSYKLKDIIDDYYYELKEHKKRRWYAEYRDFWIVRFEYPARTIEIDYWLDHELYELDKVNDSLIDYEKYADYGIKQKELNYNFLYRNKKKDAKRIHK